MRRFSSKQGISLIAVLMFMLAATTASIVVFRWIGSENFASGARLKQTEAYQAAESGIEATQAWLQSKGQDVGSLVKEYSTQKKAIILTGKDKKNNILGIMSSDPDSDFEPNFKVYLIGIETVYKGNDKDGNAIHKFKFLSVGKGRDNSKVKLAAIFDVDGLYKMKVPKSAEAGEPGKNPGIKRSTKVTPYFGGTINLMGTKRLSAATILGDLTGNPAVIDKDLIVTGNVRMSGSGIEVGENLCVGGDFQPDNNNVEIKGSAYIGSSLGKYRDAYSEKDGGFMGVYQDVYCEGDMKMRNSGSGVTINGSLTIKNGELSFYGGKSYPVKGDMLIDTTARIASSGLGAGYNFEVCGSVWSNNAAGVVGSQADGAKVRFSTGNGCSTPAPHILEFKSAEPAGGFLYKTQPGTGFFTGMLINNNNPMPPEDAGAIAAKEYCNEIWRPVGTSKCKDGSNYSSGYLIDDPIASALDKVEAFLASKVNTSIKSGNFQCLNNAATNIQSQGGVIQNCNDDSCRLPIVLNDCYNKVKTQSPSSLYGGQDGYLVVKLNQGNNDYVNNTKLDGKFILIYETKQTTLFLSPVTESSRVMMFLKKGAGNQVRASTCDATSLTSPRTTYYNYFIYSLENIEQIPLWPQYCPLAGNFYFPTASCARLMDANNNFRLEENAELVDELMEAGILCKRGGGGSGEYCGDDDNNNNTPNPDDGNSPSTGCSDPTGKNCIYTPSYGYEDYWIAVSSRLKVSLVSKNISREKEAEAVTLKEYYLAMPRVVRITKEAFASFAGEEEPLRNYYTLMPLNNAEKKKIEDYPYPTCTMVEGGTVDPLPKTGELPDESYFRCHFGDDAKYSDFYVAIGGKSGGSRITLSPSEQDITQNHCQTVALKTFNVQESLNFNVDIKVDADNSKWQIDVLSGYTCQTATGSTSSGFQLRNCSAPSSGEIATFNVCTSAIAGQASLEISSSPEITNGVGSRSTIMASERITVKRTYVKGANFVECPSLLKGNWIIVTCKGGQPQEPFLEWTCDGDETNPKYTIYVPDDAPCSIPSEVTPSGSATPSGVNKEYTINADLQWKSYTVTVSGGSLNFSTTHERVPANESSANGVSTFKVYHGATYEITSASTHKVTCSSTLNCNYENPFYIANNLKRTITPTGAGTITLSAVGNPEPICQLPASVKSPFRFVDVVTLDPNGYCPNGPVGVTYNLGGTIYTQSQIVSLNEGSYNNITVDVTCEGRSGTGNCGTLTITEEGCGYDASSLCGGIPIGNVVKTSLSGAQGDGPKCFYATSISMLGNESGGNGILINGQKRGTDGGGRCGNTGWGQQPCETVIANVNKIDGGYYIYAPGWYGSFTTTGGEPTCAGGSTGSEYATCDLNNLPKSCYVRGERVPRPNVSCKDGRAVGTTNFYARTSDGTLNNHVDGWVKDSTNTFYNTGIRTVTLAKIVCGGTVRDIDPPITCGTLVVEETSCPGAAPAAASCNLDNLPKKCYTTSNDPVPRPNVSCTDGSTPGAASFFINTTSAVTGWNNLGGVYQPGNAANGRPITLASLVCGGVTQTLDPHVSCGSIDVKSSSSECPAVSNSCTTQATTCATPLITYPTSTVPSNPCTACFKYTNNKCYVCKISNQSGTNTCYSGWVWNNQDIQSNLDNGYWYQEVNCPVTAPTITSCNLNANITSAASDLPSKKPTITLNDPSNVCSGGTLTNETWSYTLKDGNTSSGTFTWNSSMAAGTYSGFSVSGTCNGQTVSGTCTSGYNVTVSASSQTSATCNINNFTKSCYATSNDPVPRPNVVCTDNSTPGAAEFYIDGSAVSGWNNPGGNNSMGSSGDARLITLGKISCGSQSITLNPRAECGRIKIGNCPSSSSSAPSSSSSSSVGGGSGTTIASNLTLNVGTHTIANTIKCSGACTSGNSCTTTGIGGATSGSCAGSPGYNCGCLVFTAGSTVTISNAGLRLNSCSTDENQFRDACK